MLHWIDFDIVFLCFHGSSSWCFWFIVTLFIFVLMVLPCVALNWSWHCLSVFFWVFLMLHWIDCDIVYLCSYLSSLCCIELIVTLFICVLICLPHVALDWSGIVYLCSHCSYSCCIGLIMRVFICVLMGLPYVALDWLWHCLMVLPHIELDWLWHCLSLFSWFLLMLHWIDCDIVYLCFYGSFLCCIGLMVTLFICILMVLSHVALDSLLHCLSLFLWFFLMLHWIDCGIVYLCSHWSSSWSIVLIVTVFICVLLFLSFLHWIDCDIVFLCSYGSSSCCIGVIVTLLVFVLMVLPLVALDWLWHY